MTQSQALDILKTGAHVFLTGEPGAGKTHTINAYIAYLREHGIEPAITASTGIAATHIHGQTIHSWSGIGIRRGLSPYDLEQLATTEHLVKRIRRTSTLIIDEVSMIDSVVLDMVDAVCREIRASDEAFGGIQVVLVGDFFQLPPIGKHGEAPRFAFESAAWSAMRPIVCYLTEQHRQQDERFIELLGAIRSGEYDMVHHEYLTSRQVVSDEGQPRSITRLFPHNVDVDEINNRELAALEGMPQTYTMTSKGKDALVAGLKKGCLSPETLVLKVGAIVMCTKNNPQQGYVNGTLGYVKGFEPGTKYPIIETVHGDRITIETVDWVLEEDGKPKASITQIPLRLAWAITIHKSQGMSLDAAVMDLREVFEYGQGYVALSRVRTLEGLYLLGWNKRAVEVHPEIRTMDTSFVHQSVVAEHTFGDIPKGELSAMHERFIRASGGVVTPSRSSPRKKVATDTLDHTLMLVLQGRSIADIAKERALTPTTIYAHLEKLVQSGRVAYEDLAYLITDKIAKGYSNIKQAYIAADTSKLAPIHELFKGRYTFDELRIARMMMVLEANE